MPEITVNYFYIDVDFHALLAGGVTCYISREMHVPARDNNVDLF